MSTSNKRKDIFVETSKHLWYNFEF